MQDLYTVDEVAQTLRLHVKTVRQYVRDGRLKATRIGKQYRVVRKDFEAFAGPTLVSTNIESAARARTVEVSSIVAIDSIDRAAVIKLTNALLAAANAKGDEPALRVETIYDEARTCLKVILIGETSATAYMLGLIKLHAQS